MDTSIVTKTPWELDLLRLVLPPELQQGVRFVAAGSRDAVVALSRTILSMRRTPVAVVVDANTIDPETLRDHRQSLEEVIQLAAPGVPLKIVSAVPTLESVFFENIPGLERAFGQPIPESVRLVAPSDPKGALEHLFSLSSTILTRGALLNALRPDDVAKLRTAAPLQELQGFLETNLKRAG